MRSLLYLFARLLGDVGAVRRGRVPQRIWSRVLGRLAGGVLRRLRL